VTAVANANTTTLIDQAKEVLRKQRGTAQDLFDLAKSLKKIQKFNFARRVLALASQQQANPELSRKIVQQHASCTEKDPDLPLDRRHQRALEIIAPVLAEAEEYLRNPADAAPEQREKIINEHQETFGIAGAIHKRWWQVDTQVRHLVQAQETYEKGWRLGLNLPGPGIPDQGYTGINSAFVLDLLAQQVPDDPELVVERRQKAQQIREEIRARLSALPESKRSDWWSLVTLAEACFGLRDYEGAREWLGKAATVTPPQPWERETTVKQLAMLAMIQGGGDKAAEEFQTSEAWSVLSKFVGGDQAGLLTAFSGKVGLALSGGGFRASLFHIGVLARLAELDMLRHVEVLSCVSGGSIIGALYYLKVRKLLEGRPDNEITRQDYIRLVDDMEKAFTADIQHNPRMQVFSKLLLLRQRTEEMGKLLDETLYGRAAGLKPGERPELRSLRIYPPANREEVELPRDRRSAFVPKYDNWRRANKVPILIINATALNTGHNWQFTASFMGESPNQIVPEVDGNERLRRMYFDEKMPEEHQKLPLGLAVAASAGVPGLFRPVKLAGLYPNRDVELVDGGVHDNQGIGGLLEQDCRIILASDASGQLVAEPHPSRLETSVLFRSNNTLQSRVRELEYRELTAKKEAGLLRDILFVHLKKDLAVEPVDWLQCDLAKESRESEGVPPDSPRPTSYGIRGDVQNLLAGIRTDLDAFSEAEAYALMSSGYKMTARYFPESIKSFKLNAGEPGHWRFQHVDAFLSDTEALGVNRPEPWQVSDFLARLKLAAQLLFKAPRLLPNFRQLKWIVWASVIIGILVSLMIGVMAFVILLGQVPILLLPLVIGLIVVCVIVFVFARGGLYRITNWFDQLYLEKGSLAHLLRSKPSARSR
jgi:predicted acylesterase/phospholipase RssA